MLIIFFFFLLFFFFIFLSLFVLFYISFSTSFSDFCITMQRLSYAAVLSLTQAVPRTALLIDVRDENECKEGMIPTAINIPLSTLPSAIQKSSDEFTNDYGVPKPALNDKLVVYCLRGGRAEKGASILTSSGFTNVDLYPGSWLDWSSQNKA